jgi:hypothetical protein
LLLLAVLAAGCLLLPGAGAGADPEAVLTNLRIPLSGAVTVALPGGGTDTVTLAGPLHVLTRVVPPNPISPTDPCRCEVFANAQGIDGTGASGTSTRGRRYRLVGASETVAQPTDPCQRYRANLQFRLQSSEGDVSTAQGVVVTLDLDASLSVSGATAAFSGPVDVPPGGDAP